MNIIIDISFLPHACAGFVLSFFLIAVFRHRVLAVVFVLVAAFVFEVFQWSTADVLAYSNPDIRDVFADVIYTVFGAILLAVWQKGACYRDK